MARKSRVPDGWVSLCQLLARHAPGNHDTRLAIWVCRLSGIRIRRQGPDRALAIAAADEPLWLDTYRWHRGRPVMPRRRRRRTV